MMEDASPQERARRLIDDGRHMTVATAGEDGRPWVSPVFYSVDDDQALYWVSDKEALHSVNVRDRPDVSIVIYELDDGVVDAVYVRAIAAELNEETEVRLGIDVMALREQPEKWRITDVSDVTGDGPWRIYRAIRQSTQVRVQRTKQGKPVVERVDADF
jgi:nitroimidazol reductase NimA-like FMN-containing flavoprotein (pyridoxamine 5'-phosphate oxidase superfamily)